MADLETNTEFVRRLMEFSSNGAMMQMMVITALEKYADQVLENRDEIKQQMKNSMIHPEAWIHTAEELKRALDNKYGKS